jgi:hypothetical protein
LLGFVHQPLELDNEDIIGDVYRNPYLFHTPLLMFAEPETQSISYQYCLHKVALDILDWAEHGTINQIAGQDNRTIQLAVFDGDTARITLLEQRGYSRHKH